MKHSESTHSRPLRLSFLLWLSGAPLGCAAVDTGDEGEREPVVDRVALDALINSVFGVRGSDCPGVAVIVKQDGQVIAERQFGNASLELGVPFTQHHVVRLPYSEGREFMAIATVLMENDGLLQLRDPVRGYFPQLPEWSEPVTIRDLIFHRSGFVDEWSVLLLMHSSMANRFDRAQFLKLLREQPAPEIEPASGYMYSNSDYGLLRLILEQAAQEDLGSYMKRRMFGPLGMLSTRLLNGDLEVLPNHARVYAPTRDGYRHQPIKTSPGGDYSIGTTARDLMCWADAHSDPGSEVSRAVARLIDGETSVPGLDGHYAFGQTVAEMAGHRVMRHEGVLGCNYLTRVPDANLSVITFGNRFYEPEENRAVVALLLGMPADVDGPRVPTEPIEVSTDHLARCAGDFVSTSIPSWESRTMARDLVQVRGSGGALELELSWGRFALVPTGAESFVWDSGAEEGSWGMQVEFDGARDGVAQGLIIRYDDGTEEKYARLEDWTPPRTLLERLAGRYHSAHLDYSWTLLVDDAGELVLCAPTLPDIRVEPYREGEFLLRHEKFPGVSENVWVRFHEDAAGRITHLTAWHPRLMHHRFDRK